MHLIESHGCVVKICCATNALNSRGCEIRSARISSSTAIVRGVGGGGGGRMIECDPAARLSVSAKVGDPRRKLKINKVRAVGEGRRVRDVRIRTGIGWLARARACAISRLCRPRLGVGRSVRVLFSLRVKVVFILAVRRRALRIIMHLNARPSHESDVR